MNIDRKTVEMALSALENFAPPNWGGAGSDQANAAFTALRTALDAEKPADVEPVAWMFTDSWGTHFTEDKRDWYDTVGIESVTPLYTHPTTERRVPEWQPIETAPKDGNLILVTDGVDVVVGYWDFALRTVTSDLGDILTHWMPLPAAPKQEETK